MESLDPFRKPPRDLVRSFKVYQKLLLEELQNDSNIMDFSQRQSSLISEHFTSHSIPDLSYTTGSSPRSENRPFLSYESKDLPGLIVVPSMLSDRTQRWLLDRLLHRDLADAVHLTNLHTHYHVPYSMTRPELSDCGACHIAECSEHQVSFFNTSPSSTGVFQPLDDTVHKPLTISQVLKRKLRWITLGGQYDWTNKQYPDCEPPAFPQDVGDLVQQHFPEMNPEAAIVNIYSPGDTLSLHRDVSEHCDSGLVSISMGCEALFLVGLGGGNNQTSKYHILRLRSGDAVYMNGPARYAWHGVPQVLASTCPTALQAWPATEEAGHSDQFEAWRGWMATKRINLNVRQMKPAETVEIKEC